MKVKVSEFHYNVRSNTDVNLCLKLQSNIDQIEKELSYETSDCSGYYVLISHSLTLDEDKGKGILTTIWQYKRV